ncbi:MAG: type II toxin-antitoxin system RelE/ParE family toxin [Acidobacteria bacterium]|nr:type II toxin-antitoxin system RelE/ParE family toxin [Acidobacteriota bacterium]MCL5287337.1 type II toxin-antitoxin system RelE/ParE family toxin [Acidobacteriota bacterium]
MILSFRDQATKSFWETGKSRRIPPANLRRVTLRKLFMLDRAATLDDLRVPPGNRLEALARDRAGQHSIRINDQFRICFTWKDGNAFDVEITDYH